MRTRTEREKLTLPSIDDVPVHSWTKLAEKKIFFGHQSVGYNIVDGILDVMSEYDHVNLRIAETREPAEFRQPIFAHSRVGRNTDPLSKIENFKDVMDCGIGENVDIAFFKFCYVDLASDSDLLRIFTSYSSMLEELKSRYSEVEFLHVTVPIVSLPRGARASLKHSLKLISGKPSILQENVMRARYNKLLSDAYSKTEAVFDLAFLESVDSAGFRCYVGKDGQKVHVLAPEYTEDGGHLNRAGKRRIAEQLLIALARKANGV